jgi:hypothetical protein
MMTAGEVRKVLERLRDSIPLMTVGGLRETIADLPDDMQVMLYVELPTPAGGVGWRLSAKPQLRCLDLDQGRRLDPELSITHEEARERV